jgi:ATP-dependent DNA ligase
MGVIFGSRTTQHRWKFDDSQGDIPCVVYSTRMTDEVFSRQGWLFEPKRDGERCLAFRRGRDLNLFSRNRIRLNEKYPEVVEAFVSKNIADGEILTFDGEITSFAKLQGRMQVAHPSADLIRKVPVWFYVFDLLYLDRYDIRQVPLRYRKQVLRNAFCRNPGRHCPHGPCRARPGRADKPGACDCS